MALKRKISKSTYEGLNEVIRKEYVLDGDDYVLDVEGIEDTGALQRAHERQKEKNKKLTEQLAKIEGELETLKESPETRDVKAIEEKLTKAHQKELEKRDERLAKLSDFAKKSLADNIAMEVAKEISTSPSLMLPHIKSRIIADLEGDEPTTKVLSKDGKTNISLDDLKKEILDTADFAPILVGNRARGGNAKPAPANANGGNPQNKTPSASNAQPNTIPSPRDLVNIIKNRSK